MNSEMRREIVPDCEALVRARELGWGKSERREGKGRF